MCLYTVARVYIVYAIDVVLFKNTIPVPCVCTLFRPLMSFFTTLSLASQISCHLGASTKRRGSARLGCGVAIPAVSKLRASHACARSYGRF